MLQGFLRPYHAHAYKFDCITCFFKGIQFSGAPYTFPLRRYHIVVLTSGELNICAY